jgi:hypothetical protein
MWKQGQSTIYNEVLFALRSVDVPPQYCFRRMIFIVRILNTCLNEAHRLSIRPGPQSNICTGGHWMAISGWHLSTSLHDHAGCIASKQGYFYLFFLGASRVHLCCPAMYAANTYLVRICIVCRQNVPPITIHDLHVFFPARMIERHT